MWHDNASRADGSRADGSRADGFWADRSWADGPRPRVDGSRAESIRHAAGGAADRRGLSVDQGPVPAVASDQAVVRARFRDLAIIHDDDQVRVADRRQPMCDHDRRGLDHGEIAIEELLGQGVQLARRLIEQQDRWVLHQRSGQRDSLPLTAR